MSCSETRKVLCGQETCSTCLERSFATHPRAVCWSEKNDKKPHEVLRSSNKKFWFDCEECGHAFQSALFSIQKEKHCPFCANQQLCSEECQVCLDKSCASHERMKASWSPENALTARDVFLQSNKKILFDCILLCDRASSTIIILAATYARNPLKGPPKMNPIAPATLHQIFNP